MKKTKSGLAVVLFRCDQVNTSNYHQFKTAKGQQKDVYNSEFLFVKQFHQRKNYVPHF